MEEPQNSLTATRTTSNGALWQRLEDFNPDTLGASFPFTQRLARENGWSTGFAQRVLQEYRKFCYLARVCEHHVTPSDEVDQAWHLHLTYSDNYWNVFCPDVLGADLHHGPTRGGAAEKTRYKDQYEQTLTAYREHFGETAPVDIWPNAKIRFGRAPHFRRVNLADKVVFRKHDVRRAMVGAAAMFAILFASTIYFAKQAASLTKLEQSLLTAAALSEKSTPALVGLMVLVLFALGLVVWLLQSKTPRKAGKGNKGSGCGGAAHGNSNKADSSDAGGGDGGSGCGGCGGGS